MIYVFLAEGFEETEAIAPIDMLRRAKCDVVTVGLTNDSAKSSHGVLMLCDMTDFQVELDERLEMIVLPGGTHGTANLEKNPVVQAAIEYCVKKRIPIGAICAAPSILGKKGVLKGVKATAYPDYRKYLDGAKISEKNVVTDDIFTTAAGAGVSVEFGLELVKVLKGEDTANAIREAIQCEK